LSRKLDDLFLTRARQRGLLSASQVQALQDEIGERNEPDLGAHELAVEKGWVGVEAALALLDARPEDTVADLAARIEDEDEDAQALEPESTGRTADTERFQAVHDVEIELRSGLGEPATVEVIDRIPVTNDHQVDIDLLHEAPAAERYAQEELDHPIEGGRRWEVNLGAGGRKKIELRYQVVLRARDELMGGNRRD